MAVTEPASTQTAQDESDLLTQEHREHNSPSYSENSPARHSRSRAGVQRGPCFSRAPRTCSLLSSSIDVKVNVEEIKINKSVYSEVVLFGSCFWTEIWELAAHFGFRSGMKHIFHKIHFSFCFQTQLPVLLHQI